MRKIHWWFYLFFDPRYAADLKEIKELHEVEGMHSNTMIFEMKDHFLDYVVACENVSNPIVAPIGSTVQEASIYSEKDGASRTFTSKRQTNMYMNERMAQDF